MSEACSHPPPLQRGDIDKAVQDVCQTAASSSRVVDAVDGIWTFRPAKEADLCLDNMNRRVDNNHTGLSWGIVVVHREGIRGGSGGSEKDGASSSSWLSTFSFGYSTWDGRVLYLDQLAHRLPQSTNDKSSASENQSLDAHDHTARKYSRGLLAKLALCLGCSRLTWHHLGLEDNEKNAIENSIDDDMVQPEYLKGWLTLQWEASKMRQFLETSVNVIPPSEGMHESSNDLRTKVQACLKEFNHGQRQKQASSGGFRIRLATAADVETIHRLVQGLAVYEKEGLEAVHVTPEQYRTDGFDCEPPLFYCFLLDSYRVENDGQPTESVQQAATTCGMAFCFLGYSRESEGLFLYLEDLFIEEEYRRWGGGTLVMQTLAYLSLALGCKIMRWQALDWNTPALEFYDKIGARVEDNLFTSRFAGISLWKVAGLL